MSTQENISVDSPCGTASFDGSEFRIVCKHPEPSSLPRPCESVRIAVTEVLDIGVLDTSISFIPWRQLQVKFRPALTYDFCFFPKDLDKVTSLCEAVRSAASLSENP